MARRRISQAIVDVLAHVLRAGVILFMVGSLAGLGLALAPRDALVPLRHGRFVVLALVVPWVIYPAIACLVLWLIPLEQPYATGLLLLALAPCAPFAPAMVQNARGDPAYMAAFVVLSALATVAIMPAAAPLILPGLSGNMLAIARPLVVFVLLPLACGVVVKAVRPRVAERALPGVATATNIAGAVVLVLIVVLYGRGVIDAIGSHAILAQVVFLAVATCAADVCGASLADEQRSVLTIGSCTRNLGAALAPLTAVDRDPRAMVMIVICAPVTIVLSGLVARALNRRRSRRFAIAP
jgi:predicted Na+-dependent transporter